MSAASIASSCAQIDECPTPLPAFLIDFDDQSSSLGIGLVFQGIGNMIDAGNMSH
jgi:hypothetical protein